ncbi:MAG: guanine deaminase [Candidatus Cloacimonetes bacterium]|nr:guanine deaminase [Candidatus Cloacimonadota bacterium]
MKYIATNIITPISSDRYEYITDCWLGIENGIIAVITKQAPQSDWLEKRDCLCLPGLIDSHVHLSQFDIRGYRSPELLQWLHRYVFPAELLSLKTDYALDIAERFYLAALSKGTTTTVVYTSPFKSACEATFQVAEKLQVRSIIGMTMMNQNCPEYLKQDTYDALADSVALCEKWQNKGLLDYIFSPRFAITCTETLLRETGNLAKEYSARIQSHLAENHNEIEQVNNLFPQFDSYTDTYYQCGILGNRTIMGHAIHLHQPEIELLRNTDTRIAFCPDSNFFLKSGKFPFWKLIASGIKTALASDVGAGTDLSMFQMMKMADYTVSEKGLNPANALYYSTLAAAEVIGLKDKIGSIETGKEADLIFIERNEHLTADIDLELSQTIFLNQELQLDSTWVKGRELFRK